MRYGDVGDESGIARAKGKTVTPRTFQHDCVRTRLPVLRALLSVAAILPCWAMGSAGEADPSTRPPNILWLIAENMGPDLGCYGTREVATPNLDRLAAEGVRYTRAFATGPVCSSSRSAFMTGMYQTAIGAHNHFTREEDRLPLPPGVRPITDWLREAGYFTANVRHLTDDPDLRSFHYGTAKVHLNFRLENNRLRGGTWIEGDLFDSDRWQDLQGHQPFFAQVNFPNVERGVRLFHGQWTHNDSNPKCADPAKIELPPYYPDTPVVREDWAGYLDSVSGLDVQVGWVLKQLEQEGLADDTVVIFFADNGRLEARGLDWCYDSGLHVPLIIRWPRDYPIPAHFHSATASDQLISLIDVTATTLTVGEVRRPESMHGRVFLGPFAEPARRYVFGARDRTDEAVNRIRTVRSDRYRYIRNFMPEKPFLCRTSTRKRTFPFTVSCDNFNKKGG